MDFFLDILFLGIILLFPIFCSSGLQTQGFSSFVIYLSKACAKSEGSEKVLYFLEEKLIQIIAELKKWKVSGTVGVRFFYSLLKIKESNS